MIDFTCPACSTKFRVGDDFAGKKVRCKKCAARLRVVGPGQAKLLPPKGDPLSAPAAAILGKPPEGPAPSVSTPAPAPPGVSEAPDDFKELPPDPAPVAGVAPAAPVAAGSPPAAVGTAADGTKRPPRWAGALFALIGLGCLAGAVALGLRTKSFVDTASHASGKVIELVEKPDHDNHDSTYSPRVRFEISEGKAVEFTSSVSSKPPAYDVGDSVDVLYDPKNPQKAEINSFVSLWLGPIILGILGLAFTPVGAWMLFGGRKPAG